MVMTHSFDIIFLLVPVLLFGVPWAIGFIWILPDANRRGQPGILWALLTIPLGWIAVLAYTVVRALQPRPGL